MMDFFSHRAFGKLGKCMDWVRCNTAHKAVAFGLMAAMVGCQSISDIDTAALEAELIQKEAAQNAKAGIETLGSGTTRVALVLNSNSEGKEQQFRNGAALAMRDLGAQSLTLLIIKDLADPNVLKSIENPKPDLVAFSDNASGNQNVSTAIRRVDAPLISLGYSTSAKIYSFVPDGLDSLIAGVRYAANGNAKHVVLVSPKNRASIATARLTKALGSGTKVDGTIAYDPANASLGFSNKDMELLQGADIVAFSGSDARIATMIAQLKDQQAGSGGKLFVGNNRWTSALLKGPKQAGTIVAVRDKSGMNLIAKRYQQAFGTPLTETAAFAYDVVAVAAGIVRKNGSSGIARKALQVPSGFRGSTGLFRFRDRGRVERLYQTAVIEKGSLKIIDKGPVGF